MKELLHDVPQTACDTRLSDYLKYKLKLSSSLITRVKWGGVSINGEVVTMRATVRAGDVIRVRFPEQTSENIEPMQIPLDIVYEDDDLLIVNKPENMPTHPSRGNSLPTLANAVMGYYGGNFVFRAVTRLDRDTSGLVIIGKNPMSCALLCKAVCDGKIKKQYTAVVSGTPEEECGVISAPIRREIEGSIKRCVAEDGKPAVTEYRVIDKMGCDSVCEVTPITGRTHQIRVHFAHIGHPLRNDFLYGERTEGKTYMLSCTGLEFKHPMRDEILKITVEAPFLI